MLCVGRFLLRWVGSPVGIAFALGRGGSRRAAPSPRARRPSLRRRDSRFAAHVLRLAPPPGSDVRAGVSDSTSCLSENGRPSMAGPLRAFSARPSSTSYRSRRGCRPAAAKTELACEESLPCVGAASAAKPRCGMWGNLSPCGSRFSGEPSVWHVGKPLPVGAASAANPRRWLLRRRLCVASCGR
jgi:hypothetical protein